jgi:hypothetical protein
MRSSYKIVIGVDSCINEEYQLMEKIRFGTFLKLTCILRAFSHKKMKKTKALSQKEDFLTRKNQISGGNAKYVFRDNRFNDLYLRRTSQRNGATTRASARS